MDSKLKSDWTTALRSGEFKQCRSQLKNGDGFCCLGVLAVVMGFELAESGHGVIADGIEIGYRPIEYALGDYPMRELWERNDGTGQFAQNGQSFAQIADHIDAVL